MSAEHIASILGDSRWVGAQIARAQVALRAGADKESTARTLYEGSSLSLTRSREIVGGLRDADFESYLEPRKKTGSAENPITKMFPAAVTERQFLDQLDSLREMRPSIDYRDERFTETQVRDLARAAGLKVTKAAKKKSLITKLIPYARRNYENTAMNFRG